MSSSQAVPWQFDKERNNFKRRRKGCKRSSEFQDSFQILFSQNKANQILRPIDRGNCDITHSFSVITKSMRPFLANV